VEEGRGARMAVFSQDLAQDLPLDQPALDFVLEKARALDPLVPMEAGRAVLGALGLTDDTPLRPIGMPLQMLILSLLSCSLTLNSFIFPSAYCTSFFPLALPSPWLRSSLPLPSSPPSPSLPLPPLPSPPLSSLFLSPLFFFLPRASLTSVATPSRVSSSGISYPLSLPYSSPNLTFSIFQSLESDSSLLHRFCN
jgi:hypothetical protein